MSVLIYGKVLRQKCRLVKDPPSDEMQELAMNAIFTCVLYAFGNISVVAKQCFWGISSTVVSSSSYVCDS